MKTLTALILAVALLALPLSLRAATGVQAIGKAVTFSVTVATGTAPFTYQWKKDGAAIPGATGAAYTIPAVAVTDAGTYTVTVSNMAGSTGSDEGNFTVVVNPGGATVTITTP